MKDKFEALKQKLKSIEISDYTLVYLAGAVGGSAITYAIVYTKTKHDYDQLLTLPLGKEAYNALINEETNFVRFWTGKHDYAFRVTLDH